MKGGKQFDYALNLRVSRMIIPQRRPGTNPPLFNPFNEFPEAFPAPSRPNQPATIFGAEVFCAP